MKLIQINKELTKKIIADAYKISVEDVINPSLCIHFGNYVYMFKDAIERGIKQGMHLLYIKNFRKESSGDWFYNLNESCILFIDKSFFQNMDISGKGMNIRVDISNLFTTAPYLLGKEDCNDKVEYKVVFPNSLSITNSGTNTNMSTDTNSNDLSLFDSDPDFKLDNSDNQLEDFADQDRDYTKLTRLEYACLLLKVPNSGKEWMDRLIIQSRNLDNSKNKY